jgi:SSS family solute:Na+ symporter
MDGRDGASKTQMFDFSFDLTKATVWGFIFLVLFDVVLTFPKDQVLMQRTLVDQVGPERRALDLDASRLIMIPGGFVFYTIGTALFVYLQGATRAHEPAAERSTRPSRCSSPPSCRWA